LRGRREKKEVIQSWEERGKRKRGETRTTDQFNAGFRGGRGKKGGEGKRERVLGKVEKKKKGYACRP